MHSRRLFRTDERAVSCMRGFGVIVHALKVLKILVEWSAVLIMVVPLVCVAVIAGIIARVVQSEVKDGSL